MAFSRSSGPIRRVSKVRVVADPLGKDPDERSATIPRLAHAARADAKAMIEYFMERNRPTRSTLTSIHGQAGASPASSGAPESAWRPGRAAAYYLHAAGQDVMSRSGCCSRRGSEPVRPALPRWRRCRSVPPPRTPALDGLGPLEARRPSLPLAALSITGAELPADEPLPFRDAATSALIAAWRERVGEGATTAADLEAFVTGLDPVTAGLARDLLAQLAANGDAAPLDPGEARAQLRTCLLRLRAARIEEAIHDGQLLLAEAQRDEDAGDLEALKQQINQLGREKADLNRAMETPAQAAGVRRN